MKTPDLLEPVANEAEAEMAKVALRCLTTALDHSNAPRIVIVDENGEQTDAPALALPPQAIRFFAEMLKRMAQQQPIMLMPQIHELTTQEAAAFLNVSRPFVIKEIEAGRLKCHKVNRHRRIEFSDLQTYQMEQKKGNEAQLQKLTELSEKIGMEF